jgi:hypothetical protein
MTKRNFLIFELLLERERREMLGFLELPFFYKECHFVVSYASLLVTKP